MSKYPAKLYAVNDFNHGRVYYGRVVAHGRSNQSYALRADLMDWYIEAGGGPVADIEQMESRGWEYATAIAPMGDALVLLSSGNVITAHAGMLIYHLHGTMFGVARDYSEVTGWWKTLLARREIHRRYKRYERVGR